MNFSFFSAYRGNKISFLILIIFIFSSIQTVHAEPTFGPQSSTKNIEWDFDFVEEFDGLADWTKPAGKEGNVGEEVNDDLKMPRLTDGSKSAWTYYSKWNSNPAHSDGWIASFGDNRVWRGTKSAGIDLDGNKGPERLGFYWGDGYKNKFHLFFMVNIPKNEWPTSCESGACQGGATGIYTEGQAYTWFSSWKFVTFNYACKSISCWENTVHPGYSPVWHQISHLKQYNYGDFPGITVHEESSSHESDVWGLAGDKNLNTYIGDWMGFEYSYTQTGDCKTIHDVWVYDKHGNSMKVVNGNQWNTNGCAPENNWDFMFFGGNNSGTYSWGPTMESGYYIDDVIVDDKRIGPKYFALINGTQPKAAALPPSNINSSIKN